MWYWVVFCVVYFFWRSLYFPCFPRYPFVTISLPSGSFLTRCVNFPTIFLRDSKSPSWHLNLLSSSHLAPHYTTLHHTTPHYTTLHYTTPHHTTPHYTILHHATPHYTTLHHTTLHYTTFYVLQHVLALFAANVCVCRKNVVILQADYCVIALKTLSLTKY